MIEIILLVTIISVVIGTFLLQIRHSNHFFRRMDERYIAAQVSSEAWRKKSDAQWQKLYKENSIYLCRLDERKYANFISMFE